MRALLLAALLALPARAQHEHHGHGGAPAAMSHRDGSGTSWQPDSTTMAGWHARRGPWTLMAHGFANLVYDRQGGPRGGEKLFSASMGMARAERALGPGRLSLRGMLSLDPLMGPSGYPLLLQAGESSNGRETLVDRQHPHDLFMEAALAYAWKAGDALTLTGYLAMPGEPALGPPVFMHRFSGVENPAAPIGHHWLDSTHISYGVATVGAGLDLVKLEASVFTGREPDRRRWDLEKPRFDSFSTRLSVNPHRDWSLQLSVGAIESPEGLDPDTDVTRVTVSAIHNAAREAGPWQTTFAWGMNKPDAHGPAPAGGHAHGETTHALLLESALRVRRATVFGRVERLERDDLTRPGQPGHGDIHAVGKASLGGLYDFIQRGGWRLGAGLSGSLDFVPRALRPSYGRLPFSTMLWLRLALG